MIIVHDAEGEWSGMNELRELLMKQHREYMNKMNCIAWYLRWRTPMPWEIK